MRVPPFTPQNLVAALLLAAVIIVGALAIAQDQETLRVRTSLAASDPRFPEYLARLLGAPLNRGDSYVVHTDGDAVFAAMLDAIGRAWHRVAFETYVYESGEVANRFTTAFEAASRRGVDVRIVLDESSYFITDPAMMHVKALVIDGVLSIIGSANFDNRSLELNDELNVAVFDRALAERLLVDVECDITRSAKLDLATWRARPLHIRAREKLWSVFGEVF